MFFGAFGRHHFVVLLPGVGMTQPHAWQVKGTLLLGVALALSPVSLCSLSQRSWLDMEVSQKDIIVFSRSLWHMGCPRIRDRSGKSFFIGTVRPTLQHGPHLLVPTAHGPLCIEAYVSFPQKSSKPLNPKP